MNVPVAMATAAPPTPAALAPVDQLLIDRVRAGDAAAFREVFRANAPAVRRFVRNLVGEDPPADEATQECFVRAHAALVGGAEVQRLLPWLLGVARNVVREQRRLAKGRPLVALDGPELELRASTAPDPERVLLGREADAALSRALEELADDRREALVLRVDQGLSYEDVAAVLGWNVARVKNEIHRARTQLRASLVEKLGTEGAGR